MSDEKIIDSNLEPLNDADLDLAKKFGHIENGEMDNQENKKETPIFSPEQEIGKEVIGVEKDSTYNKILSKITSKNNSTASDDDITNDANEAYLKMDADSQVQHLVNLAMNKGVVHAVKVAKKLEDNYVLDMMHDKMIEESFHAALVENKLITRD